MNALVQYMKIFLRVVYILLCYAMLFYAILFVCFKIFFKEADRTVIEKIFEFLN